MRKEKRHKKTIAKRRTNIKDVKVIKELPIICKSSKNEEVLSERHRRVPRARNDLLPTRSQLFPNKSICKRTILTCYQNLMT